MEDLTYLDDILRRGSVEFDIRRNEEMSGAGSGNFWSAELAPPLWEASISLSDVDRAAAGRVDALARRLGTNGTVLITDPTAPVIDVPGPVTISGIAGDRGSLSLAGLPDGQAIFVGNRLSVSYGTGLVYYAEFCSDVVVAGGAAASVDVFPYVPFGVEVGDVVDLARPACKMKIETHRPFASRPADVAGGGAIRFLQKP